MEVGEVAPAGGVDGYDIPGCHHHVIKVRNSGFRDAVKEVDFDVAWNDVEYPALSVFGDGIKTCALALV